MSICKGAYVYLVHVKVRGQSRDHSPESSTLVFQAPICLGWLASELQGSSSLCLPWAWGDGLVLPDGARNQTWVLNTNGGAVSTSLPIS